MFGSIFGSMAAIEMRRRSFAAVPQNEQNAVNLERGREKLANKRKKATAITYADFCKWNDWNSILSVIMFKILSFRHTAREKSTASLNYNDYTGLYVRHFNNPGIHNTDFPRNRLNSNRKTISNCDFIYSNHGKYRAAEYRRAFQQKGKCIMNSLSNEIGFLFQPVNLIPIFTNFRHFTSLHQY